MSKHEIESRNVAENGYVTPRRRFLKMMALGSLLTLNEPRILNAAVEGAYSSKALALRHAYTGEKLKLTYFERGYYIEDALQEISYLLRDYHASEIHPVDPVLLDQLYDLKLMLGIDKAFEVTSGYRCPHTNARLRKRRRGVAKDSLHMQGRAIDFRVDGLATHKIRNAALTMHCGGVGYSQRFDFIHLDTGSFRSWLS
ncbi:MAG: YcbK family protein [Methylobacter sp.]